MDELLTFAAPILAADTGRRLIAGRLVRYGELGDTSAGPTVIAGPPEQLEPGEVVLVIEHDVHRPLGRAVALEDDGDQLTGRFRLAATTAGTDALIEAADQLRDGLSVGAEVLDAEVDAAGVLHVTAWRLRHVGLVTSPAFATATVTEVAAARSAPDPDPDPDPDPEADLEADPDPVEVPAVDPVTEQTDQTDATEQLEPAEVTASAPTPQLVVADRAPAPIGAGRTVQLMVAASQGDPAARDLLTAATGTAQVQGLIPTEQSREVVGVIDGRRPVVDSVERRELPAAGTTFQVPVRVTKSGVTLIADPDAPALADSGSTFDWLEVSVEMFAGKDTLTVHAIERSDPSVLDDMLRQFAESYAQQTDGYVASGLLAGAEVSGAAGWPNAIVQGITDSAEVVRQAPEFLLLGLSRWSELKRIDAGDGRRLFPRLSERNAQGTLDGSPFTDGDAEGLTTRVSLNVDPDTAAVYPSMAGRFYEGPGIAQVRAMQVGALAWEIGVYGYVAYLPKYPTAVRTLQPTAPTATKATK